MRKVTVKVTDPNKYISTISTLQNRDIVIVYIDATAVGKRKIQDCIFEDKNIISIVNRKTKEITTIKVNNLPFNTPVVMKSTGRYTLMIHYIRRHALGNRIIYSRYED